MSKANETLKAAGVKTTGAGKKSGGESKYGRERKHPSSARYTSERRWETNRVRRIRRHVKRYPADLNAREILARDGGPEVRAFLAAHPGITVVEVGTIEE